MNRPAFALALALVACGKTLELPEPPAATSVKVTEVRPASVFEGQRVEVLGSGFGRDSAGIRVFFGAIAARPESVSEAGDRLVVEVPPGAAPGKVTVEVGSAVGAGGELAIAGAGFPGEGRVGRSNVLGREVSFVSPMPDGDGLAALLMQRVASEGQGAFGRVRADGSFTRMFDGRAEAAWVNDDAAHPFALLVTFDLSSSNLPKAIHLHRHALAGNEPDRTLQLSTHDLREYESPSIAASPDGHWIAVSGGTGIWLVEDDGTTMTERDFHEPRGEPFLPAQVEWLGNGVFLAVQRLGILAFDVVLPKPVRDATLWKPKGFAVTDVAVFSAVPLGDGGFLVAVANNNNPGVTLYRTTGVPSTSAAFGDPVGTIPTPLVAGVEQLAFADGGARLAVASSKDVTVYDTSCALTNAPGCLPTPLASSFVDDVTSLRAGAGVVYAARPGGISAFSSETGAFIGSVDVASRFLAPVAIARSCNGAAPREVFELLATTFRTVLTVDPSTLSPILCGTTLLPGTGRVYLQVPIPGSADRLVLTERAGGGAEIWRQTPGKTLVSVGAPAQLPDFQPGCEYLSEGLRQASDPCGYDQQLRVSADGKWAVVRWYREDPESTSNYGTAIAVLNLETPVAAGFTPKVAHVSERLEFQAPQADGLVVAGPTVAGSGATMGRLSWAGLAEGRLDWVGRKVLIGDLPGGGAEVGDSLAPGLFAFVLPTTFRATCVITSANLATGDVQAVTRSEIVSSRVFGSPDRRHAVWLESLDGYARGLVWHALKFGPDGTFETALPSLDLPVPTSRAGYPVSTAPGVGFSLDGSRAVVTVPDADVVLRVD